MPAPGAGRDSEPNIYPNPVGAAFHLTEAVDRIWILDLTGKIIREVSNSLNEIDVTALPQGTYLVRMEQNDQLFNRIMVKQ